MKQFHVPLAVVMLGLLAVACQPASTTEETGPAADEAQSAALTPESPSSSTAVTEVSQPPASSTGEAVGEANPSALTPESPSSSAPSSTDEAAAEAQEALGTLSLEQDKVEHGSDVSTLQQVISSADFFAQDAIRVTEGGEALLDFGDQILMRMFNDTEMQVVSAVFAEDAPPVVVMHLFRGGFTGQLAAEGAQAVYETPGGATITVLGTDYFVAYDSATEVTSAGNFEGQVEASGAGSTVMIEEGFYVEVPAGQPPGPQQPLPLSHAAFEARARALQSPLAAVDEAGEWLLEISYDFRVGTLGGWPSVTWSGRFSLEGDEVVGEGTGTVSGENNDMVNLEGQFEFDIGGRLINNSDGRPTFEIEIMGHDLDLATSPTEICASLDDCAQFESAHRWFSTFMVEELFLNSDPIEVEAADGARAVFDRNWSTIFYQGSVVGSGSLLVCVTVRSAIGETANS